MMKTLGERIKWARDQKNLTQTQVADAFGLTRNAVSLWESNTSAPTPEKMPLLAKFFGVNVEWLWSGNGSPYQAEINIVGYVGAGGSITPVDDHEKGAGIDQVSAPISEFRGLVAVIVRGSSMHPVYHDGDILLYTQEGGIDPEQWINAECIVKLTTGEMFVKVVKRGTRGLWTLASHNAPDIENVAIEWAAPVRWTKRKLVSR